MKTRILDVAEIIGADVESQTGDTLGTIETIMLDQDHGEVAYVVLSYGGFLGLGDKLFAMPWDIFRYNAADECFVVNVSKEALKSSPGFDKDHWPDMSDPTWETTIHNYYGTKPHVSHL